MTARIAPRLRAMDTVNRIADGAECIAPGPLKRTVHGGGEEAERLAHLLRRLRSPTAACIPGHADSGRAAILAGRKEHRRKT